MPHDMNGTKLNVGDVVLVPMKVKQVYEGADLCNVELETVIPMKGNTYGSALTCNAGQTRKE